MTCGLVSLVFMAPEGGALPEPSEYLLTAISSTSSVVVAEAHAHREAMQLAEQWRSAHPEIARQVPEGGWGLDAYREEDGRTLYRVRADFAPEPQTPSHHHDD
ncbi:MAG: hypothetical protein QM765_40585 [Myxococcales bacterium]